MTDSSNEYRAAYKAAEQELAELLRIQEAVEKRIVLVRQNVQSLKELCESEAIKIAPSKEAQYILNNATLTDEIEGVLRTKYPDELRASDIRREMEKLGHDWDAYTNPLATIHMVLKRLIEGGKAREREHTQGFRVYQFMPSPVSMFTQDMVPLSTMLDPEGAFFKAISGLSDAQSVASAMHPRTRAFQPREVGKPMQPRTRVGRAAANALEAKREGDKAIEQESRRQQAWEQAFESATKKK